MQNGRAARQYGYDNIKFLLIFCVVFAHLLEVNGAFHGKNTLYRLIYAFHMPAFVFLSGYFARYNRKKIVFHLLYTYLLMQVLYTVFHYYVMTPEATDPLAVHFTTPYWLLWYLLAMVIFYLLVPLFEQTDRRKQAVIWLALVAAALLFGFDSSIGAYVSLARVLSFLPYFVLGMYAGSSRQEIQSFVRRRDRKTVLLSLLITAAALLSALYLYKTPGIEAVMMFGSTAYGEGYGLPEKAQIMLIALIWIAFLMLVLQRFVNAAIPAVSAIGRNTFPIFILHGFVVRLVGKLGLLNVNGQGSFGKTLLLTVALLGLFGNPVTAACVKWLLTGEWLERLWKRLDGKPRQQVQSGAHFD